MCFACNILLNVCCPTAGAGEDYPCGGRLLLFEIVRSSSGGGSEGLPGWTGRLIYTRCVPLLPGRCPSGAEATLLACEARRCLLSLASIYCWLLMGCVQWFTLELL